MKLNRIITSAIILFIMNASYAEQNNPVTLKDAREQIARQYILDLQSTDYKDISQLFEKNGFVISTSRGQMDAKNFFYAFLPNVTSATTELHQTYVNPTDNNRMAVRFHFSFQLNDGEQGDGEYIDEFVFSDNSAKLTAVYMFENLKFPTTIK